MKLLIILLCIASERYLVHLASENRRSWFQAYYSWLTGLLPKTDLFKNPYLPLAVVILPVVVLFWIVLSAFGNIMYGVLGFFIQLLIFYFCLGPDNPFYPVSGEEKDAKAAANYFASVNNQLFAVIFWFIVAGPLAVIIYRLVSLCAEEKLTQSAGGQILGVLDWLPVRVTVLLYLLVGHFQKGFHYYSKMFLSSPENNAEFLKEGGLLAAELKGEEEVTLPYAQILVEHALVVSLVFLALFTLVAWL